MCNTCFVVCSMYGKCNIYIWRLEKIRFFLSAFKEPPPFKGRAKVLLWDCHHKPVTDKWNKSSTKPFANSRTLCKPLNEMDGVLQSTPGALTMYFTRPGFFEPKTVCIHMCRSIASKFSTHFTEYYAIWVTALLKSNLYNYGSMLKGDKRNLTSQELWFIYRCNKKRWKSQTSSTLSRLELSSWRDKSSDVSQSKIIRVYASRTEL